MKTKFRMLLSAIMFSAGLALLFAALALPVRVVAKDDQDHNNKHHHYKLIDLETFGGPTSYFTNGFDGILNNHGTAAGWADTSTPDPVPSFCYNPDCFVSHAFQWRNGVLTDLGTLVAGWSSSAFWISRNGRIARFSEGLRRYTRGVIGPKQMASARKFLIEGDRILDRRRRKQDRSHGSRIDTHPFGGVYA